MPKWESLKKQRQQTETYYIKFGIFNTVKFTLTIHFSSHFLNKEIWWLALLPFGEVQIPAGSFLRGVCMLRLLVHAWVFSSHNQNDSLCVNWGF